LDSAKLPEEKVTAIRKWDTDDYTFLGDFHVTFVFGLKFMHCEFDQKTIKVKHFQFLSFLLDRLVFNQR